MSPTVAGRPAGRPSTITTSAWPWDSPAVRKRSTLSIVLARLGRPAARGLAGCVARMAPRARVAGHGGEGSASDEPHCERRPRMAVASSAKGGEGGGSHLGDGGALAGPELEGKGGLVDEHAEAVDGGG